ncbi:DUF6911 family protein [Herbaspirillum huttiense]|uniref:DUF6911 family protein n=1 Tax=Herbaspirillum huttiense TaxID=863372 RepID=UPI0010652410
MSKNFILSWTASHRSAARIGGMLSNPDWASVEEKLDQSVRLGGTVTLDFEDENGCSRSLQVRGENGRFIVTFGMEVDGDWIVRAYKNAMVESQDVEILGDIWNSRLVCTEKPIVFAIFSDFFETGSVSKTLMP